MSQDLQRGKDDGSAPQRALMPPYRVVPDFLDEADVQGLLDYAIAHQPEFSPTRLGKKQVNPAVRVSSGLRELGPYRQLLSAKINDVLPALMRELGVTPFDVHGLELELVAHGDGAFFKRHIDTQTAQYETIEQIRVLSGVYYFNAHPKAFSGGALRLYGVGPDAGFVDVEPRRNSLLLFPSWAQHEVRPVVCPSGRFIDSRFAINCWLLRKKQASAE